MKSNSFALQGRQKRLFICLASTLFVFSAVSHTSAQPGGCYKNTWRTEYCREQREKLLERFTSEIEHLDKQIARDPETADHYYRDKLVVRKGLSVSCACFSFSGKYAGG